MKYGRLVGVVFSITGILAGVYLGVSPILEVHVTHQLSGQQAGIYFASIGTIIGLSCAAISIIFNRAASST